jgi:hypothetical protein
MIASDSGRIEFAIISCSTATPSYTGPGMSLTRGGPTVYSNRLQIHSASGMPGSREFTRNRTGFENTEYYYYGNLIAHDPQTLGPAPLVSDVSAITIPTLLLLCVTAIAPGLSLWKFARHRRSKRIIWLCRSCGSALRANTDRCPESGNVP